MVLVMVLLMSLMVVFLMLGEIVNCTSLWGSGVKNNDDDVDDLDEDDDVDDHDEDDDGDDDDKLLTIGCSNYSRQWFNC